MRTENPESATTESASALVPAGPDFVGVGVQKSGTSWVGDILAQHPQVLIRKKELNFFVHHFHRGYRWYEDWFREKGDGIAGEISVNYLLTPRPDFTRKEFYPNWNPRRKILFWRKNPSARDELRRRYPRVRVFAVFRNPVDRAWSHYWYWRNRKERLGKRTVPFEKMFEDDGRWIRTQGNYADLLAHWREAFPRMGVFFYEDIRKDPARLARDVYRFVGADDSHEPELRNVVNKGSYNPMPGAIRKDLIEAYRDQIERLSGMTGRNLEPWLAPAAAEAENRSR
jgi:hypothetical protein